MVIRLGSFFLLFAALFSARGETPASPVEFPFRFSEGLLSIQVRAPQGGKPLNFLLDSGANLSVLNAPTAQRLGVKPGKKIKVQGVKATLSGFMSRPFSLEMDTVQLPQRYLVIDLHKLSGICDDRVDGLLGADFFRDTAVQIDFAMGKIRLQAPVPSNAAQETIPLKVLSSGTILLSASINHHPGQWLRLDTGCASSLQWFDEKLASGAQIGKQSIGLARLGVFHTLTTFEAGSICFERVPTTLHSKPIFPGESGLIGNELLARYESVTIDMTSGRLILGNSRSHRTGL